MEYACHVAYQDATDERDLQGCGQHMEDHRCQQEADTLGTPIDGSCQASSLARQMEAEVELQEVLVDAACHFANGFLSDTGKDGIAQLLEEGGTDAGQAVYVLQSGPDEGPGQLTGDNHGPGHCPRGAAHGHEVDIHRIDNVLEVEGNLHVENLRANEQPDRQAHTRPCPQIVLWPQILGHLLHDGPVGLALLFVGDGLLVEEGIRLRAGQRPLAMRIFSVKWARGEDSCEVRG